LIVCLYYYDKIKVITLEKTVVIPMLVIFVTETEEREENVDVSVI